MASAAVLELFDKAVASDEVLHLDFANSIPEILSAFPKPWIEESFVPFLASWLPRNNKRVVASIVDSFAQIVACVSQVKSTAPLVEAMLCSDDSEIATRVAKIIQDAADESGFALMRALCESKYDCVRKFVSKIMTIVESDDDRRVILQSLAYDPSFKVRFGLAKVIPNLPDQIGQQVAMTLQGDRNGRIRAVLPAVCSGTSYYLESIAPQLVKDHDWSVKTSVASSLLRCRDPDAAFMIAAHLLSDGVWQVKLCCLRSMTALLPKMQGTEVPGREYIQKSLSDIMRFPYIGLKNAVTDCVMAMYQKTQDASSDWTVGYIGDLIVRQPARVRLHFLECVVKDRAAPLLNVIRAQLYEVLFGLSRSEQPWRLRLGVAEIFCDIESMIGDAALKDKLLALCLQMLGDEATPVRAAAAAQLANMSDSIRVNGSFPQYLTDLSKSDTYRKRQAAVRVMAFLHKKATNESDKEALAVEMNKFLQDPCPNVVTFAQAAIDSLSP